MERIVRTVEIKGITVALDTVEKLNKAFQLTNQLLSREQIGSEGFERLSKTLGIIRGQQDVLTSAQRNFNNELKASGSTGATALDQLNARVKDLRTTIRTLEAQQILGDDIDVTALENAREELARIRVEQRANRDEAKRLENDLVATGQSGQGAYRALSAELINLRTRIKDLAAAGDDDTFEFREAVAQAQALDKELKDLSLIHI